MGPTASAEAKTQPGVEVTTRRAPRIPWSPTEDYLLMCMVKGKDGHVARLGDGTLSHSPGPEAPPGATWHQSEACPTTSHHIDSRQQRPSPARYVPRW
ncbi:hypothetical protein E4U36_005204 [Claviceps purpurea]|nr:hypothetical protein E4U36_005204 [Claviceps purpurea]KAG6300346.1 hypothetical protein E4U45_003999 [Claviceps purpurea]